MVQAHLLGILASSSLAHSFKPCVMGSNRMCSKENGTTRMKEVELSEVVQSEEVANAVNEEKAQLDEEVLKYFPEDDGHVIDAEAPEMDKANIEEAQAKAKGSVDKRCKPIHCRE